MSKSVYHDDRQLNLDFNSVPVVVESSSPNNFKVVNLKYFAQTRKPHLHSPPVLNRLLQEAQKLRW